MAVNEIDPTVQEIHDRALARRVFKQMRIGLFSVAWVREWAKDSPHIRDELNKCKEILSNEKRKHNTGI